MKKLLIVVVGVLTMTACGNKTKSGETIDSTLVDSLMTDSVVLGVSDLWTVDAVEAQIRLCFEEVNRMAEADGIYRPKIGHAKHHAVSHQRIYQCGVNSLPTLRLIAAGGHCQHTNHNDQKLLHIILHSYSSSGLLRAPSACHGYNL